MQAFGLGVITSLVLFDIYRYVNDPYEEDVETEATDWITNEQLEEMAQSPNVQLKDAALRVLIDRTLTGMILY